eukprot:4819788-Pleurochrysis_carterae.AAC.1
MGREWLTAPAIDSSSTPESAPCPRLNPHPPFFSPCYALLLTSRVYDSLLHLLNTGVKAPLHVLDFSRRKHVRERSTCPSVRLLRANLFVSFAPICSPPSRQCARLFRANLLAQEARAREP